MKAKIYSLILFVRILLDRVTHKSWNLFWDGHRHRWFWIHGGDSAYEWLCQQNSRLRYDGYTRRGHQEKFLVVQEQYRQKCKSEPQPSIIFMHNTALKPLDMSRHKWQMHLGKWLWDRKLIE